MSGPVDVLAALPDALSSMIPVTKKSFFATVGQLDVHPYVVGDYDETLGHRSDWKRHGGAGEHVATTIGGTHLTDTAYLVTPAFYANNRAALANVGGAA